MAARVVDVEVLEITAEDVYAAVEVLEDLEFSQVYTQDKDEGKRRFVRRALIEFLRGESKDVLAWARALAANPEAVEAAGPAVMRRSAASRGAA